ncbi:hypothetical protein L484_024264 [Morus notabilis]|uniref:Uncharacterized protein n=1 Tax=Morus notabilis TaxID=981085 RepID=W9QS69_9ROSA|nr:hypothetical protein L484_024264 [Morus notabilis]
MLWVCSKVQLLDDQLGHHISTLAIKLEENRDSSCEILGDKITNFENLDEEKFVDHFKVDKIEGKGEEINFIGAVEILNGSIKGVHFIGQLVGMMEVEFEEFKIKEARRCHRCIFFIFFAFHQGSEAMSLVHIFYIFRILLKHCLGAFVSLGCGTDELFYWGLSLPQV